MTGNDAHAASPPIIEGALSAIKGALSVSLVVVVAAVTACQAVGAGGHQGEDKMPVKKIEQALKEHTPELMAVPGVVGTAEGLCGGRPCIKVYVRKKTPELARTVPGTIDGYPVIMEETGEIRALPKEK